MPWLTNGRDAFIEGHAPDEMLCPSISSLPEEADFERPTCAVLRRTLGRYSRLAANGHEGSLAPRRATGGGERGGENPSPHRSCRSGRGGASLDALLPVLYLRGVSTSDFQEALAALLGKDAPNLSPAAISRLTAEWPADYDVWQKRDLSARRSVYVWGGWVYLQAGWKIMPNACWC